MTTHLWASPPFTQTNNTDLAGLAQSLLDTPAQAYSGLGGALRARDPEQVRLLVGSARLLRFLI